jgi:hypothetical protein
MLDQPKRRRRPPAEDVQPNTPIWCPWCAAEHPASAFNKETRRFSGLAGICRVAMAEKRATPSEKAKTAARNQRRWADPEYRAASLEWQRARRLQRGANADLKRARMRLQRIVDDWKVQGCIDCGYQDIRAIDPDHRDAEAKVNHLSRLVTLCASAARIQAELAKCDPRCARCHRQRTQVQRPNSWRQRDRLPPSWRRRLELQDFNDELKLALGCSDCGWAGWARGLDWDHTRGTKHYGISMLVNDRWPTAIIIRETSKCDVVCANCHRIRSCERRRQAANAQ